MRYVLRGADGLLQREALDGIKRCITPGFEALNFAKFGAAAAYEEIEQYCRCAGFGVRVCVITPEPAGADKRFLQLFKSAPKDTALVLIDEADKYKFLHEVSEVIDCRSVSETKARSIIAESGISIDYDAATRLLEKTKSVGLKLENELLKLKMLEQNITLEIVEEVCSAPPESDVFAFSNAVSAGNKANAHRILTNLLNSGTKPESLMPMLQSAFRRMFMFLLARESTAELAAAFKVQPYAVEINRKIGKKFGIMRLRKAVEILTEAEFRYKNGQGTAKDLLWEAVLVI